MKNATFILIVIVALTGVLLLAKSPTQQSRSADVLLGAALHQEEVYDGEHRHYHECR